MRINITEKMQGCKSIPTFSTKISSVQQSR
jgi:hypothetical protein